jgi:hypothetical protein
MPQAKIAKENINNVNNSSVSEVKFIYNYNNKLGHFR